MVKNNSKSVARRISEKQESELAGKTIGVNIELEKVVEQVMEAIK